VNPTCDACHRRAYTLTTGSGKRYCLACLQQKLPRVYEALYEWVRKHPPAGVKL